LNVWYYAVHDPHIGRKDLINKYLRKGMARKRAEYAAMVEAVDISVGCIRDAIQKKGLAGNTVFIFLSDQGGDFSNAPLRGGKRGGDTLAEGGSRVPLIIYVPGMEAMGQSYDAPVQTIDLYPTMVELASKKKCSDKQINGISLIPVLKGKKLKKRDLFLHRSYEDQNAAIIDGDWKLIKYRSGKLQLYNIKNDIGETTNLITVYPRIVERMLLRLEDWQEKATPRELLSSNCDL
jgi:arylsulfatase A-like enzyme